MRNELLKIGPLTVHGYGLMIAIGVIAAYLTAEYRAKKKGLDADKLFNLTVWALIGGILGAKLLYLITSIREIMENPRILLNVANGFVVYGGILGGILSGYLYCRKEKLLFSQYFDLVMPSIALAQGFGRIGCFLAGCCYGRATQCAIGITFRASEFAPNGVKLIPTQLISSGLDFLNFLALIWFAGQRSIRIGGYTHVTKKRPNGQVGALYLIFYSIGRFILEFYRGDLIRGSVGALSTSQFISIFIFLAGAFLFAFTGYRNRGPEKTSV